VRWRVAAVPLGGSPPQNKNSARPWKKPASQQGGRARQHQMPSPLNGICSSTRTQRGQVQGGGVRGAGRGEGRVPASVHQPFPSLMATSHTVLENFRNFMTQARAWRPLPSSPKAPPWAPKATSHREMHKNHHPPEATTAATHTATRIRAAATRMLCLRGSLIPSQPVAAVNSR
jgi:hypothetical protein